jgi:inorganic triphosphatase YgiF
MDRIRELELKLEVESDGRDRLRDHPILQGRETRSARQISTYFDTDDTALREAGLSLRVRRSGQGFVQTVKQSQRADVGLFDRPEWEAEVKGPGPDFEALAATPLETLLTRKLRQRLAPVIEVDVNRTFWELEVGHSRIELVLDSGTVIGGGASQSVSELEIELKAGESAALLKVAEALRHTVPMRIGVLTKAERGYRLLTGAAAKAAKAEPLVLARKMSAGEGFAAIAHTCLRHFRLNEDLVRERRDAGALHQARVAMRRLRSAFSLFRPIIADDEYQALREELRWFTDQLGDARNLDVLLAGLSKDADKNPAGRALRTRLQAAREQAYTRTIAALGSERLLKLMLDLFVWIEAGRWRGGHAASRDLRQFGREQLDRRWSKVRKGGRKLADLGIEPRHRLRIEVKKLRYAVEFLSSLHKGKKTIAAQKNFLSALEEMQERLGELNDRETAHDVLAGVIGGDREGEAMLRYAQSGMTSRPEEEQLAAAQSAHDRLREAGPFWRL